MFLTGRCNRPCDSKLLMVCGNDLKTYVNECVFNKTVCNDITGKLKKLYDGPCGCKYEPLRFISVQLWILAVTLQ